MKNYFLLLIFSVTIVASCSTSNTSTNGGLVGDTLQPQDSTFEKGLHGIMQILDTIKAGSPVELKFIVHNQADSARQFCKWHTPFEPLMSKYLDIKDENGVEVDYRGAMAKRMMPPPADSYLLVNAKDSLVATVDLLKGYAINKPSTYTIIYNGQDMSGVIVKDSVSFVYQ